jgi:hypothetical protein
MRSLADLQDIQLPDVPPLWPPGEGFWVLLALLLVLLFTFVQWYRLSRRKTAYRRAGITLLEDAETVYDVSVILKRVCLARWPRTQVAPLYGENWVQFLNAYGQGITFATDALDAPERPADSALRARAALWIQRHEPEVASGQQ